jgi:ABC-type uncharacterized transport system substrate-binding protein
MRRAAASSILVAAMLLTVAVIAGAQQPAKIPTIGYVSGTPRFAIGRDPFIQAFRERLKELGYSEGKNIHIEYRYTEGKGPAAEAENARELVRLNPDILFLTAYPSIRAAKEATRTIPIVMISGNDPIAFGLINSLARPGGNITGISNLARELSGKRLELLSEIVPNLSRVGFLTIEGSINTSDILKRYEEAARQLKLESRAFELRIKSPDLAAAFDAALKARVNGLIPIRNSTTNPLVAQIAELAIKRRLPTMFERAGAIENGGLASYTADEVENYRRAAVYVDKILKGAKPEQLPVEQPTKFDFAINLKTAKQIGLTIPPNVLARADRVIK